MTTASPWASDGRVDVSIADGVATMTFAREKPGNGWNPSLSRVYYARLGELARDESVRAIVVTGAGKDFCVGGDGDSLSNVADDGVFEEIPDMPTYWLPMVIGKPVVCAVNGASFGVGMALTLFCDVRFAGTSTKFATAFARRGLIAELGMTWLLPKIVGLGVSNDLLLSGRLVRADEALRLGLVNRVVEDDQLLAEAQAYAAELANRCSPASMLAVKQQTYSDMARTLPEAVEQAAAAMNTALGSEDFAEGVRSWREQRLPSFAPLDPERSRFPIPGEAIS